MRISRAFCVFDSVRLCCGYPSFILKITIVIITLFLWFFEQVSYFTNLIKIIANH